MPSTAEYLASNEEWYSAVDLPVDAILFLRARLERTTSIATEAHITVNELAEGCVLRDQRAQALKLRLEAVCRLFVDSGDMTPYAKMKIEQILQGGKVSDDAPYVPPEALLLVEQIHAMPAVGANADGVENNVIMATSARLNHTDETGTMLLVLGPEMTLETVAGLLSAGHHAFGLEWVKDFMHVMSSYPVDDVESNRHKGWTP